MRIGKLNREITIQYMTVTRDSVGGLSTTWNDEDQVWASIEPLSMGAREYYAAQQIQEKVTHRIIIRHRWGLTSKKRISYGTRMFEIISVVDIEEKHKWLLLICREDES